LNSANFNPLNAELNPICHLLALLGGATIVNVGRLRVNTFIVQFSGLLFSPDYDEDKDDKEGDDDDDDDDGYDYLCFLYQAL
jgi:hypothetical protein